MAHFMFINLRIFYEHFKNNGSNIYVRTFTIFVYDYISSYMELLTKANLPTLETQRIRTMAIETFEILNGLAPPVLSDLLIKKEDK